MPENPTRTGFLESLLYLDVPEPAFDRGKRGVVVVPEGSSHKRWIEIEHVLQPKRKRRVIQPGAPSTGIVLSRGDRHDVFLLAVLDFEIIAAILGEAGHLDCSWRWQVERIRCH